MRQIFSVFSGRQLPVEFASGEPHSAIIENRSIGCCGCFVFHPLLLKVRMRSCGVLRVELQPVNKLKAA